MDLRQFRFLYNLFIFNPQKRIVRERIIRNRIQEGSDSKGNRVLKSINVVGAEGHATGILRCLGRE